MTAAHPTSTDETLSIHPLPGGIGAELTGIDVVCAGDADVTAIKDALAAYGVLLLRGNELSKADLSTFAARFGAPFVSEHQEKAKTAGPEFPEIYLVSNIKGADGKSIGGLGAGEAIWHSDLSYMAAPPKMSFLYAVEVPTQGGDTWVCNLAAALDTMPDALRRRIEGRRTKHDATYTAGGSLRVGVDMPGDLEEAPGRLHPAICAQPGTGRPYLCLGRRRNAYVEGLREPESEALLDAIWAHVTRPEHIYAHHWIVGDMLIWDNWTTMHRRDAFDQNDRRLMMHIRIAGDRPPEAFVA